MRKFNNLGIVDVDTFVTLEKIEIYVQYFLYKYLKKVPK